MGLIQRLTSRRTGIIVLLMGVALLELQATAMSLRAHTRLRDRALAEAEQALLQIRTQARAVLAPGGAAAWRAALVLAIASRSGAVAEVFAQDGRRLDALPMPGPDLPWPSSADLERLRRGDAMAGGRIVGMPPRTVVQAMARSGSEMVVLRLWMDASDLAADLRDRQQNFVLQAGALILLILAMAIVAMPSPQPGVDMPSGLLAYEEAMDRLRAHDEELSRQHAQERTRMEGALKDQEALARAGELTAGIVHEVRNGLGTIVGYARLLEASTEPEQRDHARGIREECETLETVVRRFMDFVKYQALHPATFDLGRTLARVAARESRTHPGAIVSLPSGEAGSIEGDEDLLERVFENLVRNARESAGPNGHVWIDVTRSPEVVSIVVSDDGAGMSAEVRAGLRPFFTTKAGGLGLGLPMALKIVRLHGGDLVLGDREPRGLRVVVRLPTVSPLRPALGDERAGGAPVVTKGNGGGSSGGP